MKKKTIKILLTLLSTTSISFAVVENANIEVNIGLTSEASKQCEYERDAEPLHQAIG